MQSQDDGYLEPHQFITFEANLLESSENQFPEHLAKIGLFHVPDSAQII